MPLGIEELPRLGTLGWNFDWGLELRELDREIYVLITRQDPFTWQGLVSLEERVDHVYMHLIEAAPTNRGREKIYSGVAGNLVAFLCKKSFELGHQGHVAFEAKTRLIDHYRNSLEAQLIGHSRMFIDNREARNLVTKYFPDFDYDRP